MVIVVFADKKNGVECLHIARYAGVCKRTLTPLGAIFLGSVTC
jgi:hypothetical protein